MTAALNWLASLVWSLVNWLALRWPRARTRLPARVVSVGNIQAGGAGKTPLVARIAREGRERGLTVCILCRGYGGEWESRGGGVIAPGEPAPPSGVCGDEAALLHELAPDAWIGVGADRVAGFHAARKRAGRELDLAILDDGFQNLRIEKDLDIVALTSTLPWQRPFREFRGALARAQLLVWTKGAVSPMRPAAVPLIRVEYRIAPATESRLVHLVTGLADGKFALETAQAAGYRIATHIPFRDHARYAEPMVRSLIEQAKGQGAKVAVTGKDWVKWREMGLGPAERFQVVVLEPELRFEEKDREIWNRILWGP